MQLTFLGGVGTVTGSKYLVVAAGRSTPRLGGRSSRTASRLRLTRFA